MKHQSNLKTGILIYVSFLMSIAMIGISGCNNNNSGQSEQAVKETADSTNQENLSAAPTPADSNSNSNSTKATTSDAAFLVDAAQINYHEITLGNLVHDKTKTSHIIDLAKMMVDDHTKALNDLKALADKKGVKLPEPVANDQIDDYNKLSKEMDKTFDKDYADMMVMGHKKAISKFETASKTANDEDIKAWATSMLPTLKMHLQHAEDCQKKCMKM